MNKPKGMYIGTAEAIGNAYSDEVREKLAEKLDILPIGYDRDFFTDKSSDFSVLSGVEYIFSTWGMAQLDEEAVGRIFPKLKALFYAAGSVQYFAKPFLNRGVKVFSAWGANAVPVAETVVSEILLANKGFFQTLHNGTGKEWIERRTVGQHPGNFNTDVGIIGAGMIGTLVIEALKKYRLNVSVFDPFMSDERARQLGVKKVTDLPKLFEECHVVSNHLADNEQTIGMIGRSCFDKMEKNGVFINTGRGRQVVEAELIAALKASPERCAVLDVTYPEPPEKGRELYTMPNVFLTPHMAGSIGNEVQRMGEYMLDEFTALLEGKPTKYSVTSEMLKTMA